MKKLLVTILVCLGAISLVGAQDIVGSWYGTLTIGSSKLAMVLHITKEGSVYKTTMDSPDQGACGLPTSSTLFLGNMLTVKADDLGMTYQGVLKGDALEGTFAQSGMTAPLNFSKKQKERLRPQTPQPPYPYRSEDVTFKNREAGITLAGTLTVPQGGGTFPAVVLITGSGPQNRDEEILGHKPFLLLADHLTRNGIAVLRYDDRGYGASGGDYASASLQDFASDAVGALEYLKGRPEVDAAKIGLLGHSEGGCITYLIAGSRDDVAYIVSMAGPALLGADCLREQRRSLAEAMGVSESALQENERLVEKMVELADQYTPEYINDHVDSLALSLTPAYLKNNQIAVAQYKDGLLGIISPELLSLMRYDPSEDIGNIECPVLAIVGGKDLQVPPRVILQPLRDAVKPSVELTVTEYPGLNHLFQHADKGVLTEYAEIEETIAPEVLADITAWITAVTQ